MNLGASEGASEAGSDFVYFLARCSPHFSPLWSEVCAKDSNSTETRQR